MKCWKCQARVGWSIPVEKYLLRVLPTLAYPAPGLDGLYPKFTCPASPSQVFIVPRGTKSSTLRILSFLLYSIKETAAF